MTDQYWGSSSCEIGPAVAIPGISKLKIELKAANKRIAELTTDNVFLQAAALRADNIEKHRDELLERIAELELRLTALADVEDVLMRYMLFGQTNKAERASQIEMAKILRKKSNE